MSLTSFTVLSHVGIQSRSLRFDRNSSLVCAGVGGDIPDVAVNGFDARRDLYYQLPDGPLPSLEAEVRLHFPAGLIDESSSTISPAAVGGLMLIQSVPNIAPVISPLSALAALLTQLPGVNVGLLHSDGDGMLMIKRAGTSISAHVSIDPLSAFLNVDAHERSRQYPHFEADQIFLSGEEIEATREKHQGLVAIRSLAVADLASCFTFTEQGYEVIEGGPYSYALAIGAALIYNEVLIAAGS